MIAVVPPVRPGTEFDRAANTVSDMESLIRDIDRGAHALLAIGASDLMDRLAIQYVGKTLTDMTAALVEEWQMAFDILHPKKS
jgi:hypothetical protein